jgi:hypothetical protein
MFSQLRDLEWGFVARGTLVAFAMLILVPGAVIALLALAFVLSPVAIVGIPFIVPALFPGASREHLEAVRRSSYPPLRDAALAH